jgi:hypothetical protein
VCTGSALARSVVIEIRNRAGAAPERQAVKALTQDRYGTADALKLRDLQRPTAGNRQVLVRVVAAGMDRGAWHFMTGEPT